MNQTADQTTRPKLTDHQLTYWLRDQFERLLLSFRNRMIDSFLWDHELATNDLERHAARIQKFLGLYLGEAGADRGYRLLAEVIASYDGNTQIIPARWEAWMRFEEYSDEEHRILREAWDRLRPTSNSLLREIVETFFPIEHRERLLSSLAEEVV